MPSLNVVSLKNQQKFMFCCNCRRQREAFVGTHINNRVQLNILFHLTFPLQDRVLQVNNFFSTANSFSFIICITYFFSVSSDENNSLKQYESRILFASCANGRDNSEKYIRFVVALIRIPTHECLFIPTQSGQWEKKKIISEMNESASVISCDVHFDVRASYCFNFNSVHLDMYNVINDFGHNRTSSQIHMIRKLRIVIVLIRITFWVCLALCLCCDSIFALKNSTCTSVYYLVRKCSKRQ